MGRPPALQGVHADPGLLSQVLDLPGDLRFPLVELGRLPKVLVVAGDAVDADLVALGPESVHRAVVGVLIRHEEGAHYGTLIGVLSLRIK